MQELGLQPSIDALLSLGFLAVSSERSYSTAGSFLKFLIDRYGVAKLRALYHSGGDFSGCYGLPLPELERQWRAMIDGIQLAPSVIEGARERFRAGSVFARPCPHAIAARRASAAVASATGRRDDAVSLMRAVCGDAPEEPRNRLALGDYLVPGPPVERAEAERLWTAVAEDATVTSTVRAEAFERLARLSARRGDLDTTARRIDRAAELPVDPDQRRQLDAERLALHHPGPARAALIGYFFAPGGVLEGPGWAALAIVGEPELGFGYYLLGLQHVLAEQWAAAADELDRALALGVPGLPFVQNGARKLAIAAYRARRPELVRRAIALLRGPNTSEADHLLAEDWSQRLAFDETGHL
jgi:hypothetical protein